MLNAQIIKIKSIFLLLAIIITSSLGSSVYATPPIVSIIIPVYNAEPWLERSTGSVRGQTLENIEIICINDGSTDDSLNYLLQLAENDKRITVIDQENAGVAAARNTGLLHVNGEFICFLDADDYFKPELCETCLTTARRDDADIVEFGWLLYIDNKHIFHGPEREETFSGNGGWAMLNIPYTSHLIWNKFYKADLIRKSGRPLLPELQYGEDTEWNISLSPHIKNFTKIPNALIVHNYYPSSLSSTAPPVRITLSFIRRLQTLIEIAYSTGNQNLKDAACRLIKDYLSKTDERISNIGTEASLPV